MDNVQNCNRYVMFNIVIQYFYRLCSLTVKIRQAGFYKRLGSRHKNGRDATLR
jgi:hypothetical protein